MDLAEFVVGVEKSVSIADVEIFLLFFFFFFFFGLYVVYYFDFHLVLNLGIFIREISKIHNTYLYGVDFSVVVVLGVVTNQACIYQYRKVQTPTKTTELNPSFVQVTYMKVMSF